MRENLAVFLGNPIMGDDAVALRVYENIRWAGDELNMDMETFQGAGFDIVEVVTGYRRLAVVDAMTTGRFPPGEVVLMRMDDLRDAEHYSSIHTLNIPASLGLARRCGYAVPDRVAFIGIEVRSAREFSDNLSPEVEQALPRITMDVLALLRSFVLE